MLKNQVEKSFLQAIYFQYLFHEVFGQFNPLFFLIPSVTGKTFKELTKIPHFMTLDSFKLWNVPEEFDLECYYIYMKNNERTDVRLHFGLPLSDEYEIRLNSITDEIIATRNHHDYKPPLIHFDEMDAEKLDQLKSIVYGV